jgi:transcriptional regulator with XRE-family HTH domain
MTGAGTTPPAVARRRVSLALRRAREAKQWTQTQVANAMEWSLSKVMRIEKGQVNISPSDLRSVLAMLDITDQTEIDDLLADVRVSRSERYSNSEYDREHLSPATVQLLQYEEQATAILHYNNVAIPGELQTRQYASAVLTNFADRIDQVTLTVRLESRLRRTARVVYRDPPPDYRLIMDESVLFRQFGGTDILIGQLEQLLTIMSQPGVRVRVCPLAGDAPIIFLGPFVVLELDGPENAVLYRESPLGDELLDTKDEVERHRDAFERLWPAMLAEDESRELVSHALAELKVSAAG